MLITAALTLLFIVKIFKPGNKNVYSYITKKSLLDIGNLNKVVMNYA